MRSVEANKAKKSMFECGAPMDVSIAAAADEHVHASVKAQAVKERIDLWRNNMHIMLQDLKQLSVDMSSLSTSVKLYNSSRSYFYTLSQQLILLLYNAVGAIHFFPCKTQSRVETAEFCIVRDLCVVKKLRVGRCVLSSASLDSQFLSSHKGSL
jgi:hypothetical protein